LINNQSNVSPPFTRNGTATNYTIPFSFSSISELVITGETGVGTGVYTTLTTPADYTVTGTPTGGPYGESAATLVFPDGGVSGVRVFARRTTSLTQLLDLPNNGGAYNPQSVELSLDKLTRAVQEISNEASRSLRVNAELTGSFNTLIAPIPDKFLHTKPDGTGLEWTGGEVILLSDRDYGDITVTDNGQTMTIGPQAVTYAKIQNISTNNRLLGRATAGAGVCQEITLGTGLSLTGTTLNVTGATLADGSYTDITASSTGSVLTVNSGVITPAKMADIAAKRVLLNNTASSGVLAAGQVAGLQVKSTSYTNVAAADLTSWDGGGFNDYRAIQLFIFLHRVGGTGGNMTMQLSTDNGATWINSGYSYALEERDTLNNASTPTSNGASAFQIGNLRNSANAEYSGVITLIRAQSTQNYVYLHGTEVSADRIAVSQARMSSVFGMNAATNSATFNAIRIVCATGNLTGYITAYGVV